MRCHCDLCGRECDSWEYRGLGKHRVALCSECAESAVECEECGKVSTEFALVYDRNDEKVYALCGECYKREAGK